MRYDAVLFDLDGTLMASAPGIYGSVTHAVRAMGQTPPDDETLRKFIGPSMYDSMQRYCGFDADDAEKAVALYRAHYVENGVLDAHVYTGIPNLLRQLKEAGVYIAVATSKPIDSARTVLKHFGLYRYFDKVVGADLERTETDKTAIVRQALPARFTRAAMVGDRRYDMQGGKKAGVDAIGAGWGYGSPEELLEAGADAVCTDISDLANTLMGADAPATPKGFFISVEGLDGSGKTTQMNAVAEHMKKRGYDVVLTREPGGTPISEEIRHLVLSPDKTVCPQTEALLYAAARAQHVRDLIRPALESGKAVLCDRFVDSSIAYQGAGRELGTDRVAAINAFAIEGTMPDLTLLLVVDAATGFLRRKSATTLDRIERSGEAFYQRVYVAFSDLQRANPERIRCIDAQRSIEDVTRDAFQQIDRLLATR